MYEIISFNTAKKKLTSDWVKNFCTIMTAHNGNNPQIILTQEMNHGSEEELNMITQKLGSGWKAVSARECTTTNEKEQNNVIFYDSKSFDKPESIKTPSDKFQCIKFTTTAEKVELIIVNVHLTPADSCSKISEKNEHGENAMKLFDFMEKLQKEKDCGIIVGGDFNYNVQALQGKWGSKGKLAEKWSVDGDYKPESKSDNGLQTTVDADNPWDHFITNDLISVIPDSFYYAIRFNYLQLITTKIGDKEYSWYKNDTEQENFGTRLAEGATKCPVCGASVSGSGAAQSAQAAAANTPLSKAACPHCGATVIGEHRFCPSCGINLQDAANKAQQAGEAHVKDSQKPKPVNAARQSAGQTVQQAAPANTGSYQSGAAQEPLQPEPPRQEMTAQPVQTSSAQENPKEKKLTGKQKIGCFLIVLVCILCAIVFASLAIPISEHTSSGAPIFAALICMLVVAILLVRLISKKFLNE